MYRARRAPAKPPPALSREMNDRAPAAHCSARVEVQTLGQIVVLYCSSQTGGVAGVSAEITAAAAKARACRTFISRALRSTRPKSPSTPPPSGSTSAKVKAQANSRYAWKSRRTRRTLFYPFAHSSMPPEGERVRPREIGDARSPTRPPVAQKKHNTSLRATRRRSRVRRASSPELVLLRLLAADDLLARGFQRRLEIDRTPPLL